MTTDVGSAVTGTLSGLDSDGHALVYQIEEPASGSGLTLDCTSTADTCTLTGDGATATLTKSTGAFVITPSATFIGTLSMNVTTTDVMPDGSTLTALTSDAATVTVEVGVNNFKVLSSTLSVTDQPSGTSTAVSLTTSSVSSTGVLTANLPSLNADNLTNLQSGSGTAPSVDFSLAGVPSGTGTSTVSMLLKDGASESRSDTQRQVSLSYSMNWSSDGSTLVLTRPEGTSGVIEAKYYGSSAGATESSVTLSSNAVADVLKVSSTGFGLPTSLSVKLHNLFNLSGLDSAMSGLFAAGEHFYQVTVDGIPLGVCFDSTAGTCASDDDKRGFSTIQGSFTTK